MDELGWDRIRRQVYRQANYRCEVCGGRGPEHPVERHEVWRYDDRARVQALVRMIALCPSCHGVKHMGFAHARGTSAEAREHLARVTAGRWRRPMPTSTRRSGCGRSAAMDHGEHTPTSIAH